jgi:hypothetical protein
VVATARGFLGLDRTELIEGQNALLSLLLILTYGWGGLSRRARNVRKVKLATE